MSASSCPGAQPDRQHLPAGAEVSGLDEDAATGEPDGMSAAAMEPDLAEELARVVDAIVQLVDPIEVILFGSYARQDATTDSDFDLLVVMPDGTPRRATTGAIYRALAGVRKRNRAVDIVVSTPALVDRDRTVPWSIGHAIGREGRSVYRSRRSRGCG